MPKKVVNSVIHERSMSQSVDALNTALTPYLSVGKRDLPWRHLAQDEKTRFYQILVSEMMLQQTQVQRVIGKYLSWMNLFPDMPSLAQATFPEILAEWKGLGYSRRAKYLLDICKELQGRDLPRTIQDLIVMKGIGVNTAGAILVYCNNSPEIFIETNIRTVLFHHFFTDQEEVSDTELRVIMDVVVDKVHPRVWYWAMMDYGSILKKQVKNNYQSKHYVKQSAFEGSARQQRARLLDNLIPGAIKKSQALAYIQGREYILDDLLREKMILEDGGTIALVQ